MLSSGKCWRLESSGESLGVHCRTTGSDALVWTSQSTFKDVLFRVDGRLDLPRGTLIQYEHKGSVKERIKELLVSIPVPLDHSIPFASVLP